MGLGENIILIVLDTDVLIKILNKKSLEGRVFMKIWKKMVGPLQLHL
jgi:hypothetical protein